MDDRMVRVMSLVETGPGCWLWRGSLNNQGYGTYGRQLAHRLVYVAFVGPIGPRLTLDHLCRTPRCVKPTHLEPVDQRTNVLRGVSLAAKNALKTECKAGHLFDVENTYLRSNGTRDCRACKARRERERKALR